MSNKNNKVYNRFRNSSKTDLTIVVLYIFFRKTIIKAKNIDFEFLKKKYLDLIGTGLPKFYKFSFNFELRKF